eukprot:CAMPEP_0184666970 /NCGR_PEP_ID=MMETSP0308-20130426/64856_1 /TAXON_ID=38269 /ORGANISM="Gloeochaete witrockiana, Strain SAG 46.84" /LENGTH=143 /DNA_ID=CAMNT_0027111895 /DNA_START=370 /DNA_END=801 /DNA_ORIENTATION=+
MSAADAIGLQYVQLHGAGARAAYSDLPDVMNRIIVRDVDDDGTVVTPLPLAASEVSCWQLYDRKVAGSGKTFDWSAFQRPESRSWLLAGGLNPDNVSEAMDLLKPPGLDVASGVAGPDKKKKDPAKLEQFILRIRDSLHVYES